MLRTATDKLAQWQLRHYLYIARVDHWPKQIFMLAGVFLAQMLISDKELGLDADILVGLLSVCVAASANYVINEWLDRESDSFHPVKSKRPAPQGLLNPVVIYSEYIALIAISIALGSTLNTPFVLCLLALLVSGVIYNVKPVRTKDVIYLDILSEAINNPLRLLLGWFVVAPETIPPSSLMIIFWFSGAFLMAMKRFAEYRLIVSEAGDHVPGYYRESFKHYTAEKLLLFSFLMAVLVAFFLAAFIVKYKAEYLLLFPFVGLLFTYYLHLAMQENSIVQTPEKLFRSKGLIILLLVTLAAFVILSSIEIPIVQEIVHSEFPLRTVVGE